MPTWTTPRTWADNNVVTAAQLNEISDALRILATTGTYVHLHKTPTAVETLVNGILLECNGVAVSRTTYANLFAKIGTTYGVGDGSTTFNVPDGHGRSLVSAARSGGHADVTALGATDGQALANRTPKHGHSVTDGHTHTGSGTTGTQTANHTHGYTLTNVAASTVQSGGSGGANSQSASNTGTESANHAHVFSVTTGGPSGGITVGVNTLNTPSYLVAGTLFIII